MHSDEELLLTNTSSSSSCEDVWEGEGEDVIRVPSRRVKRHCKVVGKTRNWNKDRLDSEEAKRQDLEDELDRERRLVFDLDTRLLQMETEKMELIHQLKMAKQMGISLESHLIFLEEHLAAPLVNSEEKPPRQLQHERKAQQQDGALRKETLLRESKPKNVVKHTEDRETQTESTQTKPGNEKIFHPDTLIEDDMCNTIVIDHKKCKTQQLFRALTEQVCFASLQALFQELLGSSSLFS